jgi:hypothetical protein
MSAKSRALSALEDACAAVDGLPDAEADAFDRERLRAILDDFPREWINAPWWTDEGRLMARLEDLL